MAYLLDLAYVLIRMVPSDTSVLPGWTGFNTLRHKDSIPNISRVGYLPVIDASPTEYSTINTILQRSEAITDKLQLQYATLVFDEAVYAKVQHVRWKNDIFYNRFVHTIMSFLSAISRIYEDGGLKVSYNQYGFLFSFHLFVCLSVWICFCFVIVNLCTVLFIGQRIVICMSVIVFMAKKSGVNSLMLFKRCFS